MQYSPVALPPEIREAAERGWHIHPVRQRAKVPLLQAWQQCATCDLTQIDAWSRQFPGCNWGAVAGPQSGFFAVDVDVPEAMQRLEDQYGPVPQGLTNVTSEGYQLIYQWPKEGDVRPATKRPCEGIDVRGRGSYIVIPPSVHPSGHRYQYSDPTLPIPPCPAWLLTLILNHQQPKPKQEGAPALGVASRRVIEKGRRTNWLVSLAGSMHKRGMEPVAIEQALLIENEAKCSPPLPVEKVRAIAHDIPARYPNPRREEAIEPTFQPDLVCLADVEVRAVEWLWKPYLPARMLTMLSGDPGAGKSFLALAIAAALSQGNLLDGRTVEPASTLYLTCENPIAECIRPRFDLLGGDAHRLHLLQGARRDADGEEQQRAVVLSDIDVLEKAIVNTGSRLVVIDPIQSYLGANVDLHRSNETRPVLDRLMKLADSCGCAFLLLRHLSKQVGGKAIHRGLGSIDLTGAVRSEMLAGALPDDSEARALVHVKSNVGAVGRTRGYSIDADGGFAWTGESSITASDLLAAPAAPEDRSAKAEAETWLREVLSEAGGSAGEIRQRAVEAGISFATLRRAKISLHVRSRKAAVGGGWLWELPDSAQDAHQDAHTKNVSTLAPLSTLEGAHITKKLNVSSLDSQGAQISTGEHLEHLETTVKR